MPAGFATLASNGSFALSEQPKAKRKLARRGHWQSLKGRREAMMQAMEQLTSKDVPVDVGECTGGELTQEWGGPLASWRAKPPIGEGSFGKVWLTHLKRLPENPLVVKQVTIDMDRDLLETSIAEAFLQHVANALVFRNVTPSFPISLATFSCRPSSRAPDTAGVSKTKRRNECGMLFVQEAAAATLWESVPSMTQTQVQSAVFGAMVAVLAMHRSGYAHEDFRLDNILVARVPSDMILYYEIEGIGNFYVRTGGYLPLVGDFGFGHALRRDVAGVKEGVVSHHTFWHEYRTNMPDLRRDIAPRVPDPPAMYAAFVPMRGAITSCRGKKKRNPPHVSRVGGLSPVARDVLGLFWDTSSSDMKRHPWIADAARTLMDLVVRRPNHVTMEDAIRALFVEPGGGAGEAVAHVAPKTKLPRGVLPASKISGPFRVPKTIRLTSKDLKIPRLRKVWRSGVMSCGDGGSQGRRP